MLHQNANIRPDAVLMCNPQTACGRKCGAGGPSGQPLAGGVWAILHYIVRACIKKN